VDSADESDENWRSPDSEDETKEFRVTCRTMKTNSPRTPLREGQWGPELPVGVMKRLIGQRKTEVEATTRIFETLHGTVNEENSDSFITKDWMAQVE
jgi:hypothetical protein